MSTDTIVTVPDVSVIYVAGEAGKPIGEQAPKAFKELEAKLPSLKGRRFYGVVLATNIEPVSPLNPATTRSLYLTRLGHSQAADTFAGESRTGKRIFP